MYEDWKMRNLTFLFGILSATLSFGASSLAQSSQTLKVDDGIYKVQLQKNGKTYSWEMEVTPYSELDKDSLPVRSFSKVEILKKTTSGKVVSKSNLEISKIDDFEGYINLTGVKYIEVNELDAPLFLVQVYSLSEPQGHERLVLISPKCKSPIATAAVVGESIDQVEVNTGVKDFLITYPSGSGKSQKKWTAPHDSGKLCRQSWKNH